MQKMVYIYALKTFFTIFIFRNINLLNIYKTTINTNEPMKSVFRKRNLHIGCSLFLAIVPNYKYITYKHQCWKMSDTLSHWHENKTPIDSFLNLFSWNIQLQPLFTIVDNIIWLLVWKNRKISSQKLKIKQLCDSIPLY